MRNLLHNIDALLITNPTNVRYLTGFVGAAENEREAYVLLTKNHTFLFTNALYLEQAKTLPVTVIEISTEEPFSKKLGEVVKKRLRVGFEETDLTVSEYHKIMHEHNFVVMVPTNGRVEKLRTVKSENEMKNIRAAAKLTDRCFDYILGKLKPGVAEKDIAWAIESFIKSRGAQLAFPPIVAFGKNTSQPHYHYTRHSLGNLQESVLKNQDIILLDFGARVNGYASDMTRVVFTGEPKEEWKQAYRTVREAQKAALEYLNSTPRGGATGAKADRVARKVIEDAGFTPYPHSLGHGVGLGIHEAPRLTIKKPFDRLRAGMVVTVEPAIYKEGSYGIRIEDLVVLKKEGVDVLSKSQKGMIVL